MYSKKKRKNEEQRDSMERRRRYLSSNYLWLTIKKYAFPEVKLRSQFRGYLACSLFTSDTGIYSFSHRSSALAHCRPPSHSRTPLDFTDCKFATLLSDLHGYRPISFAEVPIYDPPTEHCDVPRIVLSFWYNRIKTNKYYSILSQTALRRCSRPIHVLSYLLCSLKFYKTPMTV